MGQIRSHPTGIETPGMGGTGTEKIFLSWDGTGNANSKKNSIPFPSLTST